MIGFVDGFDALILGLDFAADGVMYGASSTITSDSLYAIDLGTGQGTLIGPTNGDLVSIASITNIVPEPGSLILWSAGILVGVSLVRIKNRQVRSIRR